MHRSYRHQPISPIAAVYANEIMAEAENIRVWESVGTHQEALAYDVAIRIQKTAEKLKMHALGGFSVNA